MNEGKKILAMQIEYDGTNYAGWQRQKNALAIQEVVEKGLSKAFNRPLTCIGAGRTDAGVHARGQVAHSVFREPSNIPDDKVVIAVNSKLPNDICIRRGMFLEPPFHATSDAIAREYSYSVHTMESVFLRNFSAFCRYPIDAGKLREIAKLFRGSHDFTTFSKHNAEVKNYVCNIEICEWEFISDFHFVLHIKANRFVYGMVRALVGVMLDFARGARTIDEIRESLGKNDRNLSSPLAPAQGLVLERVYYPFEIF